MANTTALRKPGLDELDDLETAFLIIDVIIFIPTVFGNTLIIVSIYKFKWLQTPLNALIGNLALSDLLVGLVLIPTDVLGTFLGLNSYKYVCLVQLSAMLMMLMTSLCSMLAISIERCFSVTYPHKHRAARLKKGVTAVIILSWIFAAVFSCVPIVGWNNFSTASKCRHVLVWPKPFRYVVNVVIVILVTAKIVFFSLTVRVALRIQNAYKNDNEGVVLHRRMGKTYILIIISAMFIVCWTPYCSVALSKLFAPSEALAVVQSWTLLLAFCNAALNWLIYGLKNHNFRKAFGILLCRKHIVNISERPSS